MFCFQFVINYGKINLLLTERESRTGEYWPEVVAVRTESSEVRTKRRIYLKTILPYNKNVIYREVRMGQNCPRGLENISGTFFSHTDLPSPVNNMFIFSCSKLVLQITNGFVYATLVIECLESACAPSTNDFLKNLGNQRIIQIVDKERCIKEHIVFELLYGSCNYLTS